MSFIRSVISSARKWLPIGALAAMTATSGNAQDYGKVGEPIKLVIGYQPYWTPGFAPAILRSKEMWRKYLPAGCWPANNRSATWGRCPLSSRLPRTRSLT